MTGIYKNKFLETPKGQYGRYMSRRLKGRSHYTFDVEPKSKKSMKKGQKIAFQQDLLKKLKESKRRAYRAPIVAELSFDVIGNTPPFIHTVVKNFQDLFETPFPGSPIKRKGLIYQNDKNIYGLSVRYHISSSPQVRASFAPLIIGGQLSGDSLLNTNMKHVTASRRCAVLADPQSFCG